MDDQVQAHRKLELASRRAYEALTAKFSSTQIAQLTGMSPKTVRKLRSDGGGSGWRPLSLKNLRKIDELSKRTLNVSFGLAAKRMDWDQTEIKGAPKRASTTDGRPSMSAAPYLATMRVIRSRTTRLVDRDDWLARIRRFAFGGESWPGIGTYGYIEADPWAGKTALVAHAMQALEADVTVVGYFLSRREADADLDRFFEQVVPQLSSIVDEDPAPIRDLHSFRALWLRSAQLSARIQRPLLLVVDGLDEDNKRNGRSVASVLPVEGLGRWARVLVTSRPNPPIPVDVDPAHPIRAAAPIALAPSPNGAAVRDLAEQELENLLYSESEAGGGIAHEILGVMAAASGPLTVRDLSEITGHPRVAVKYVLSKRAARSIQTNGDVPYARYIFAHQSLLESCQDYLNVNREPDHFNRVHRWADGWREQNWPPSVTAENGTPIYLLDAYPIALLGQPDGTNRPERLAWLTNLTADIDWVSACLTQLGVDFVMAILCRAFEATGSEATLIILRVVERQSYNLRVVDGSMSPERAITQLAWEIIRRKVNPVHVRARLISRTQATLILDSTTEVGTPSLVRKLDHLPGGITALSVLAGGMVVAGSYQGVIRRIDPDNPQHSTDLHMVKSPVTALAAISASQVVAAFNNSESQGILALIDFDQPDQSAILYTNFGSVLALGALSDGRVVIGDSFGYIKIIDPRRPQKDVLTLGSVKLIGAQLHAIVLPDDRVVSTSLMDKGSRLGEFAEVLKIFDSTKPHEVKKLGTTDGWVSHLFLGATQQVMTITSSSRKGGAAVQVFDASGKRHPKRLGRYPKHVSAHVTLPNGQLMAASGLKMDELRVLNPESSKVTTLVGMTASMVLAISCFPDGRVVTGSNTGEVQLFDPDNESPPILLARLNGAVKRLLTLPDSRIVSATSAGDVHLFSNTQERNELSLGQPSLGVVKGALLPDGRVVMADTANDLFVVDPRMPTQSVLLGQGSQWIDEVKVLPDGNVVTLTNNHAGGAAHLFDPGRPGQITLIANAPWNVAVGETRDRMTCATVLPDGRGIVTGALSGNIHFIEPSAALSQPLIVGRTSWPVELIAALPEGRIVVVSDGSVELFKLPPNDASSLPNVREGSNPRFDGVDKITIATFAHDVSALIVLTDGRIAVSSGEYGEIRIIDPSNPRRPMRLKPAGRRITHLAAFSSGILIAAFDAGGAVPVDDGPAIGMCKLGPDEQWLFSGKSDGRTTGIYIVDAWRLLVTHETGQMQLFDRRALNDVVTIASDQRITDVIICSNYVVVATNSGYTVFIVRDSLA